MRTLHGYFRSSAAFRVRIALALKGLDYQQTFIHLRRGEQKSDAYRALNPMQLLPTLVDGDLVLTQSPAILEYLEEAYPTPALLPADTAGRARVRALMNVVACDIHPVDNLRILQYLGTELAQTPAAVETWYNHWIALGFTALEAMLVAGPNGRFAHGDAVTLADVMLVPQVMNARRYGSFDFAPYPRLMGVFAAAMALPAFDLTQPSKQPDAEA